MPTLNPEQVARGATLYAQNCASCHGANLEGQPNWKQSLPDGSLPAPPHDGSGHTWHHSDEKLLDIVTRGGQAVYGDVNTKSNMPGFGDKLDEADLKAILDFIKSRWGKDEREFQWWMTATGASQ
jgi:mono/diheme cytochrome c family protein